jgi:hypothetical protein
MSWVRGISKTLTLNALGAASGYSTTDLNGLVSSVYVSISKAVGTGSKVTITTTSTGKAILTVADPSTLGAWFYPYARAQGSTANVLASSAPVPIALLNERIRIAAVSSSGKAGGTVSVQLLCY